MEWVMTDTMTILAGIMGMLIAMVHGYLGATKVVQPVTGIHPSAKRILHAIFLLSAVYWFVGGAVLVLAPFYLSPDARYVASLIVGTLFLSGAAGNFWATRGRHFGWVLLTIATTLTWVGM